MRMFKLTLMASATLIAWSAHAGDVEVEERGTAPGTAEAVWAVVGEFCAIKNWHPAVADCEETTEGGETFRTLTLQDGAKVKERLTDKDDTSYSYEIIESPLPVKNYEAELDIDDGDDPNTIEIEWDADFDADGVSNEEAKDIITGIFKAGIDGIKKVAEELAAKKN